MRRRRFVLLAAVLVALNTALWLAPQGLPALRAITLANLFGPNMERADVTMNSGAEWRVDRGAVVTVTSALLTISEHDGRIQAIVVDSTTRVTDTSGNTYKVTSLKAGWKVLVIWPALSGPAYSIKIEKKTTS